MPPVFHFSNGSPSLNTSVLKRPPVIALIVLGVLLVSVVGYRVATSRPPALPPDQQTEDGIAKLASAVTAFVAQHNNPPTALSDLGSIRTKDGWNREFSMTAAMEGLKGSIALRSSGADGVPETEDDYVQVLRIADEGYGKSEVVGTESRRGK